MTDVKVVQVRQFEEFTIALMEEDGEIFIRIRDLSDHSMEHISLNVWDEAVGLIAGWRRMPDRLFFPVVEKACCGPDGCTCQPTTVDQDELSDHHSELTSNDMEDLQEQYPEDMSSY